MYLLETCSRYIHIFYVSMHYWFLASILFNVIYRKSSFCLLSFCLVDNSCFREATSVPDTSLEQIELWVTTMTLLSVIDFRKVSYFQRGKHEEMFFGNQRHRFFLLKITPGMTYCPVFVMIVIWLEVWEVRQT